MTVVPAGFAGIGRRADGRAYFAGARPCGTRLCPNCGPQIQAGRRAEIAETVARAKELGMRVAFMTLTVSHRLGDPLDELLDMETVCWRALVGTGWWQRAKAQHGAKYWVKVIENRHGDNGWHPHIHVLLFLDPREGTAPDLPDLFGSLIVRWIELVRAYGGHAGASGQYIVEATDRDVDTMAGYFSKEMTGDLSWEMTSQRKDGVSLGPAELLSAAVDGDENARRRWQELEEATKGRRLIAYANGTRQELRLESAAPVDALVEYEEADLASDELLVTMPPAAYEEFASRAGYRAEVVDMVESGALPEQLLWWLHDRGITAAIAPARDTRPPIRALVRPPEGAPPWYALPEELEPRQS